MCANASVCFCLANSSHKQKSRGYYYRVLEDNYNGRESRVGHMSVCAASLQRTICGWRLGEETPTAVLVRGGRV